MYLWAVGERRKLLEATKSLPSSVDDDNNNIMNVARSICFVRGDATRDYHENNHNIIVNIGISYGALLFSY